MKRLRLVLLGMVFLGIPALAQVPAGTLEFDDDPTNVSSYKLAVDGAAASVVTATTVKAAALPTLGTFTVPLPAMTAGNHSVTVAACSAQGVCATSVPFALSVPSSPVNLRLP